MRGSADLRALPREHGAARSRRGARRGRGLRHPDGARRGGNPRRGQRRHTPARIPHGVEDVRGRVLFDGHAAHFSGVTGTVGGGRSSSKARPPTWAGASMSFDVQGNGRAIALRYPEGLRSVLRRRSPASSATTRSSGSRARSRMRMTAMDAPVTTSPRAAWPRRSSCGRRRPPRQGACAIDVKIDAPGHRSRSTTTWPLLQARADLTAAGELPPPRSVLGRAEIDRGRVYFQGNTVHRAPRHHRFHEPPEARSPLRRRGRDPRPLLPT